MGQSPPRLIARPASANALLDRMEGKDVAGLIGTVRSTSRFFKSDIALLRNVQESLAQIHSTCTLDDPFFLQGLCLDFDLKEAEIRLDFPPLQSEKVGLVAIYFHGAGDQTIPEGPPRVTTARGYLYLQTVLQELATATLILREGGDAVLSRSASAGGSQNYPSSDNNPNAEDYGSRTGRRQASLFDVEECPICMDRAVDTVLSCSHGLCKVCEVEWLVGEGRGTCPICRRREKEGDDWVLNENTLVLDQTDSHDLRDRIRRLGKTLLNFLTSLPHLSECAPCMIFVRSEPSDSTTTMIQSKEEDYDGLQPWMKAQLAYLEQPRGVKWAKCPRCTTFIRVPDSAESETRLNCEGCRAILPVKDLSSTEA